MAKAKATASKKTAKVAEKKKAPKKAFSLSVEFNGKVHKVQTNDLAGALLSLSQPTVNTGLKAVVKDNKTKKVATRNWANSSRARNLFNVSRLPAEIFEKNMKTLLGLNDK